MIKNIAKFIIANLPRKPRNFTVNNVILSTNELLNGRAALITGGTSGIGYHIAEAFLRAGACVVITSRNEDKLLRACLRLKSATKMDDKVFGIRLDNAETKCFEDGLESANHLVKKAGCTSGIDILVNNAGILGGTMPYAEPDDFDAVIDTNLKGAFFLSQLFGKYFKKNHIEGNILNIASSSSLRPAISAYTLSKWGIRGMTIGLAKTLAPYGITVNGIAPGPTATPMLLSQDSDKINNPSNPSGRYALPEEIAQMAVILVSPIGRTVVGDIVYMTGGAGVTTFDDIDYTF